MRTAAAALLLALVGCDPTTIGRPAPSSTEVPASATAAPRPLDQAPLDDSGLRPTPSGSGRVELSPPPEPFQAAEALAPDTLPRRPAGGIRMEVELRYLEPLGPPSLTEVELERITERSKALQPRMVVELLDTGRMRLRALGATVLAEGTALVARRDRYGHVLIWPDARRYRLVPPGALRALWVDGRADVGPMTTPPSTILPPGTVLGRETTRVAIESPLGAVELELVREPRAGAAAGLFCRAVLDLGAVAPGHEVCRRDEVVLGATLRWSVGGGVRLVAVSVEEAEVMDPSPFATPPRNARFDATGIPVVPSRFVSDTELAQWRKKVIDVGPRPVGAPPAGLLAINRSDRWRWLFVDGVPVVRVAPWTEASLAGMVPGRYNVQWRGFLGADPTEPKEITTPFRLVDGEPEPPPAEPPPEQSPPDAGR